MALRIHYKKKHKGVTFKSGYAYTFKYVAWQHDPKPTYIHMHSFSGYHPNTGRQWRFIQGINLTYVPRAQRKAFVNLWLKTMLKTNGNAKFTWDLVQRRFPYIKHAVRRYFYSPNYYITKLEEIPLDEESWNKAVVSTWSKDFSKKVKVSLMSKFKKALGMRKGPAGKRRKR